MKDNPLHSLLLNLSVDLMLRSSDLLSLKVKDVVSESGEVVGKAGGGGVSSYCRSAGCLNGILNPWA